jgi:hypothetical protein
MRKLITIALASLLLANTAFAATCAERALDKHGKPLKGAAKTAFIKKCEKNAAPAPSACEAKAVGKDGKALKGAAKAAFMKKCEAGAKK